MRITTLNSIDCNWIRESIRYNDISRLINQHLNPHFNLLRSSRPLYKRLPHKHLPRQKKNQNPIFSRYKPFRNNQRIHNYPHWKKRRTFLSTQFLWKLVIGILLDDEFLKFHTPPSMTTVLSHFMARFTWSRGKPIKTFSRLIHRIE